MDSTQTLLQNIPTTVQFIDQLIAQLSEYKPGYNVDIDQTPTQPQSSQRQNPFSALPAAELATLKPLMLTLHCLFPNELLLALDILDRGLVRRLVQDKVNIDSSASPRHQEASNKTPKENIDELFIVLSASSANEDKGYEIRLESWNCTCPSFTLSAFRDLESPPSDNPTENPGHLPENHENNHYHYPFGGTLTRGSSRSSPPVCKHILACILSVRCPALFGGDGDEKRVVSAQELAGWCAGWGG